MTTCNRQRVTHLLQKRRHNKMPAGTDLTAISIYNNLSLIVKKAFVLQPPASLIQNTENFWVIKEDEPELVTDGRRNYLWRGSGELALLIATPRKEALIFRVPSLHGRKRSITIDARSWNHGRLFSCGITAAPLHDNGKLVYNGGLTAMFRLTDTSEGAVIQMLPDRHYILEISRLMYDTASHLLLLLEALPSL